MNIAMMQPSFLPWLGFFELILKSDIFIILDDFQFSVQSYHQRNRLFVNKGQVGWYSVPIKKTISFKAPLNQTRIDEESNWRKKMWKRLQNNYSKASYYKHVSPHVENWLMNCHESLASQNIEFIKLVCSLLDHKGEFYLSSELPSEKERSERVIELLRWKNATCYYCAKGSFSYMAEDAKFPLNDIVVNFQNFQPRKYSQVGANGGFVPCLSTLDTLMNVGAVGTRELIKNGTDKWLKWGEMKSEMENMQADKLILSDL